MPLEDSFKTEDGESGSEDSLRQRKVGFLFLKHWFSLSNSLGYDLRKEKIAKPV